MAAEKEERWDEENGGRAGKERGRKRGSEGRPGKEPLVGVILSPGSKGWGKKGSRRGGPGHWASRAAGRPSGIALWLWSHPAASASQVLLSSGLSRAPHCRLPGPGPEMITGHEE